MAHLFLQQDVKTSVAAPNDNPATIPVPEQLGSFLVTTDGAGGEGKLYAAVPVGLSQAWVSVGTGAGTGNGPFSHALYVDGGTLTPPAEADGSDEAPFKTIMAAVAHLADDTVIIVMPSVYPESVDWGAFGDFDNTALLGAAETSVIIAPPSGNAFSWTPGAGAAIGNFNISGVTLRATAGNFALFIDGNATTQLFTGLCLIQRIIIDHAGPPGSDAVLVRCANLVNILDSKNLTLGVTRFTNVSQGIVQSYLLVNDQFIVTWDDSLPTPVNGRINTAFLQSSVIGQIVLDVAASVIVNRDVLVLFGIAGSSLAITGAGLGPILICAGTIGLFGVINGGINLALPAPTAPGQVIVTLSNSDISGDSSITIAGTTRIPILARGVVWQQSGVGSNVLNLGDFLDVDTRGSTYTSQTIFVVSGGADTATLDRDTWGIFGESDFSVAAMISISPPFPAGTTQYSVVPNPTNAVAVGVPPGLKTATNFTATTANPGSTTGVIDFTIVRTQAT